MKWLTLPCIIGMIWWSLPGYKFPSGTPISEAERQEIVTHLFIADSAYGPWAPFVDVRYGEETWVGSVLPERYFSGYCELNGLESNWDGPVFSGPAPAPEPPPPTKGKGKKWGHYK